jgi:hypothetical protein
MENSQILGQMVSGQIEQITISIDKISKNYLHETVTALM